MGHTFSFWKAQHDKAALEIFNNDSLGQLWLKIKSITRKDIIDEFANSNSIVLNATVLNKQFEELYEIMSKDIKISHNLLDKYIYRKNTEILKRLDVEKLVSELYKLQTFEWGGDYQNSLDKYLVSHYVKVISSYDELLSKFDHEINKAVKGYVLNSWYNHWSSILIEHIFKSHKNVLPTVGQIKNVDFFINNVPFDLKVTYFPSEYLRQKRKEKGLPVELTYLKSSAKELGINFDKTGNSSDIYYEISEKLKDKGGKECFSVLDELKKSNMAIVKAAQNNPKDLSKWLYENQGEMRFGAENRLFLILVDTNDFSNSWKLKRNFELLKPSINNFLDSFGEKNLTELEVDFTYHGKAQVFHSLADVVFVLK
jgi:hypothetical protein